MQNEREQILRNTFIGVKFLPNKALLLTSADHFLESLRYWYYKEWLLLVVVLTYKGEYSVYGISFHRWPSSLHLSCLRADQISSGTVCSLKWACSPSLTLCLIVPEFSRRTDDTQHLGQYHFITLWIYEQHLHFFRICSVPLQHHVGSFQVFWFWWAFFGLVDAVIKRKKQTRVRWHFIVLSRLFRYCQVQNITI